jgi:hypothetical protein
MLHLFGAKCLWGCDKRMAAPRLGLSMIVRDGADTLRNCLESVRGLVDEMIVVDTGSTDSSPEIARQCRAVCIYDSLGQ